MSIDDLEHCIESSHKHDNGKARYDLLPFRELDEIVKALTFGAEKYSDNGWKSVENGESRYQAAMMRHISAYMSGEKTDNESGLSHLAHAGCCLLFLMWHQNQNINNSKKADSGSGHRQKVITKEKFYKDE